MLTIFYICFAVLNLNLSYLNFHSPNVSQHYIFCRLEVSARNAHCSSAGPFSQGYAMALPNPDTYQDLNSDYRFIERNHHLFVKIQQEH